MNQNEENDAVGPLRSSQYKKQMHFGHQLSPIMNSNIKLGYKRKSGSREMSESHKSGKSFMTLNDEQKQIEISNVDLDDDLGDDVDDTNHEDDDDEHSNDSTDREDSPLLSNDNDRNYKKNKNKNRNRNRNIDNNSNG